MEHPANGLVLAFDGEDAELIGDFHPCLFKQVAKVIGCHVRMLLGTNPEPLIRAKPNKGSFFVDGNGLRFGL